MITKQYSFPQRIGKLIENYIIEKDKLTPNKRQHKKGYFDAYSNKSIFEIKAAKGENYFRLSQKNHKELFNAHGVYILVRYNLKDNDKNLKLMTDIEINDIQYVDALQIEKSATAWLEDQRKTNMYYKVKI